MDAAELYMRYLQQVEGKKFIEGIIHASRTPLWEKREFIEFQESIDWEELPAKIKNIKFTTETVFTEIKAKK